MDDYKRITINDIAKALEISQSTVSRAISGKGRISEGTRKRVQDYIETHKYTPNILAKGLAQSKTFSIGIVLPAQQNLVEVPFFQGVLLGICDSAAVLDYDVIVTAYQGDNISQLIRLINRNKVDGMILTRSLIHDHPVEYLKSRKIPFVVIGSTGKEDITEIDNNHQEACRELTSILVMKGIKSMGLIGGDTGHRVTRRRYKGYLEGLNNNGLDADPEMVFLDMNSELLVEQAVKRLLEKQVECIMCMDDYICAYVLTILSKEGLRVPDDVRVASFYNSPYLEKYSPPITALNFNVEELGRTACKALINEIEGGQAGEKVLLNYEIVLKQSTK